MLTMKLCLLQLALLSAVGLSSGMSVADSKESHGLGWNWPWPFPKPSTHEKMWAVLVAGSNTYDNYRHQADVCHAYQLLMKNNFPKENIIVMMYDDIANSVENPTPGIIINRPNGTDVYKGVEIDYKGRDVSPQNFLNVLTGNKDAMKGVGSGRVLESTNKDTVFVNFVDHGAVGLIGFPDDVLSARELSKAIQTMHTKNMYQKMVFYVEACESGSMFETNNLLPTNINVYAMTAANAEESSYACYYDPMREAYLGDLYSVKWMEDAETENLKKETIESQYKVLEKEVDLSHVEEYGDLHIGSLTLATFIGYSSAETKAEKLPPITDAVPSRDVPLAILQKKLAAAKTEDKKNEISAKIDVLLENRRLADDTIARLAERVAAVSNSGKSHSTLLLTKHKLSAENYDCYETLFRHFHKNCFNIARNSYVTAHLRVFVNMCSEEWVSQQSVIQAMDELCEEKNVFVGII